MIAAVTSFACIVVALLSMYTMFLLILSRLLTLLCSSALIARVHLARFVRTDFARSPNFRTSALISRVHLASMLTLLFMLGLLYKIYPASPDAG